MRLYLDAAPVIYAVQQVAPWGVLVTRRLQEPGVEVVVSHLTRMECRVKPIQDGNTELLADFDKYFEQDVNELVTLSREVVDRATQIRADHGLKTPDALHLGAAVVSACDAFLTNDHRLDGFSGIRIEVVDDLEAD